MWDEVAGGPGRSGAAFLPTATLDILWNGSIFPSDIHSDIRYSPGLVSTPHGLLALAGPLTRADDCRLVTVTPGEASVERPLPDCDRGRLVGYDRGNDNLLVCTLSNAADDAVFQARDPVTGDVVWGITPTDVNPGALPGNPNDWECHAVLVTGGDIIVVIGIDSHATVQRGLAESDTGLSSYLVRLDGATGAIVWSQQLSASHTEARTDVADGIPSTGGFNPTGLALTSSGIVVSGIIPCPCGRTATSTIRQDQAAVLMVDPADGDIVQGISASNVRVDPSLFYGPIWATTSGPLATFPLAGRFIQVNPADPSTLVVVPFHPVESGRDFIRVVPPVWWDDTIAVPVGESITGVDANDLTKRWSWTYGPGWAVSTLLVVPPNDLFAVVADNVAGPGGLAVLARVDLDTGDLLQATPLPARVWHEEDRGILSFQPLADGRLLLFDASGQGFLLGEAAQSDRPAVELSNLYPAPNDVIRLAVRDAQEGLNYTVSWGDGTVETGGTAWLHRYGVEGDRTVRVTAAYRDGRTATTERVVLVGTPAPPELTPLQKAFAPENYDLTFGVGGLLLTLFGALIAILARRRRHSKLKEELDALARIEARGRGDPEGAVRDLGAYRAHVLDALGRGRLDDAQYTTLTARADLASATIRTRLLGPIAGRLTADLRHMVDVALHDGRIEREELDGIRAVLDAERHLSSDDKARLATLFERLSGS